MAKIPVDPNDIKVKVDYKVKSSVHAIKNGATAIIKASFNGKVVAKDWNNSATRKKVLKELETLEKKAIRQVIRDLHNTVKNRISSIKAKGLPSPAYDVLENKLGGKVDLRTMGMSKEEMISKFDALAGFVAGKTSTISGIKAWQRESFSRLGFNPDENPKLARKVYEIIDNLKEMNGVAPFTYNYGKIANIVREEYTKIKNLEASKSGQGRSQLEKLYEQMHKEGLQSAESQYKQIVKETEKALDEMLKDD